MAFLNIFKVLCIGLIGLILATTINNDFLSTEIALLIAFLINIIAIYKDMEANKGKKLRLFSASFLFGTLVGVIWN